MTDSTTNPLAGLVAKLEALALAAKDKIVAFADKFVPELINDAEVALEDLAGFAFQGVMAAAEQTISGNEKFGLAVTHVIQSVETQGKTITLNTAHMAVQQAYLTVKQVAAGG